MEKKLLCILMSVAMLLSVCGCSEAGRTSKTPTASGESNEVPESSTTLDIEDITVEAEANSDLENETVADMTERQADKMDEIIVDMIDNHEIAMDAVANMKIGWNLGNSFDATGEWIVQYTSGTNTDFETAWGNPVTPDTLMTKIKALGFESVRIPITWRYHFDAEGNIDEEWMDRIQEVVDQAIDADLYCIINVHHDTGSDGWLRATSKNYEENANLYAKLWQQIAERFRDYPDQLLFEGFNEMLDDKAEWNNPSSDSVDAINKYNQLFVDTVRATGGNNVFRNLICNTYAAALSDSVLNGFEVPTDLSNNHLIAEMHYYAPYEFITSEGVTWTTPISEYNDYVERTIDNTFSNLERKMSAKNIPMIIGEFAADDKNNTEDRIKWYTHVIEKTKEQNMVCFIWDNGNGFCMGHIDRVGDDDDFPEIIEACINAVGAN